MSERRRNTCTIQLKSGQLTECVEFNQKRIEIKREKKMKRMMREKMERKMRERGRYNRKDNIECVGS